MLKPHMCLVLLSFCRKYALLRFAIVLSLVSLLLNGQSLAQRKALDIDPVIQQTAEWCWVAVGEMVLGEHFGYANVNPVGDYQCGIVGLYFGPMSSCYANCMTCQVPSGTMDSFERMLRYYPVAVGAGHRPLRYRRATGPLDFDHVQTEIDEGRPVVAGINPASPPWGLVRGFASHAVLVVGYDVDRTGTQWLIVNDPYPYSAANAYERADNRATEPDTGQHRIRYEKFVAGLHWTYSGYGIEDPN
jgi:hypothetical protein